MAVPELASTATLQAQASGHRIAEVTTHCLQLPYRGEVQFAQMKQASAEYCILVIRLDGGLFFATADPLEDRIRDLIHDRATVTGLVLDCEGINFIDSQGSSQLAKISTLATNASVSLRLARVKPDVMAVLDMDGVSEKIGRDRFHSNVDDAVRAETDGPAVELNADAAEPRVGG